MITLTDNQVEQLNAVIQELPTKYGVTILNLFRTFAQENIAPQKEDTADKADTVKSKLAVVEAE